MKKAHNIKAEMSSRIRLLLLRGKKLTFQLFKYSPPTWVCSPFPIHVTQQFHAIGVGGIFFAPTDIVVSVENKEKRNEQRKRKQEARI